MDQDKDSWTSIDEAAVDIILKWMHETTPKTGIRTLAPVLGMTYSQLQPTLQKKSKTPLTMGSFYTCANYFGHRPVESYVQCCMLAAIYDRNYELAGALHATYLDLSVQASTETLAKKYLNSKDNAIASAMEQIQLGTESDAATDKLFNGALKPTTTPKNQTK